MALPARGKGRRYWGYGLALAAGWFIIFRGGTARGLHAFLTDPETLWVAILWGSFVKAS